MPHHVKLPCLLGRLKQVCSATETSWNLVILDVETTVFQAVNNK